MKLFISYAHQQGSWVLDRLVPCLSAGGVELLIDRKQFVAGRCVVQQMDALQNKADRHLLVIDGAYLRSQACRHEMQRAIALDPDFEKGIVLPLVRESIPLPDEITTPDPLLVNLCDDTNNNPWQLLMEFANADLGAAAPSWLAARDDLRSFIRSGQSVNLVVKGKAKWRPLLQNLSSIYDPKGQLPELASVDLDAGVTTTRQGLVQEMLRALGLLEDVPREGAELEVLDQRIRDAPCSHLILRHFDWAQKRPDYGPDLFSTLRFLIRERRKLVLLLHSRRPLETLLPRNVFESSFIDLKTVEVGA